MDMKIVTKLFLKTQFEWDIPKVMPRTFDIEITQAYYFYLTSYGGLYEKSIKVDNIYLNPFPYSDKISQYTTWISSYVEYPNGTGEVERLTETLVKWKKPLTHKTLFYLPPKLHVYIKQIV